MEEFKIENEVNNFLKNNKVADYLITQHRKIEELFTKNCLEKINNCEEVNCLNIIFGEVTQNVNNFIYSNNNRTVAGNNFLKPASLLGKKCDKGSSFDSEELHDFLIEKKIIVIDLFSIPLPSEYYRKNLVSGSNSYLKSKAEVINHLIKTKNIGNVKCICRYKDKNVNSLAKIFLNFIQQEGVIVSFDEASLSNSAGGLDIGKFNNFIA
jgi:hypothetical protein